MIYKSNQLTKSLAVAGMCLATSLIAPTFVSAAPKAEVIQLTAAGEKLQAKYASELSALKAEIEKAVPKIDASTQSAMDQARDALKKAEADAKTAQEALGKISGAKGLVDHAKGKWIGGAEKGIAQAQAALAKATTDAAREAAQKDLAHWQANKEEGLKALKERQENLDKVKVDEPKLNQANQAAQATLAQAKAAESAAAKNLLAKVDPVLTSDKLDAKLVKAAVLAGATPRGLAEFAQQGTAQETVVAKLLESNPLMKQMLDAGGAKFGKYGAATQIYSSILKASPKAAQGHFQRLALATSLEHALPIAQSNAADQTSAPATVDPVNRYLHYEKAFLDGELDPAFKDFTVWEYRMIVDCDAPDHMLAWGREMLRNYRPDHVYNPDYGWRYSGAVRTDVTYGSQNVQYDLPSLHNYQNIIRNGGVCGRRAFFGRFILQSFGIPTWGVTQHKHAALSHWTPKGWVINLGAGFEKSWWDKDEVPRSGSDFLLESQARAHSEQYTKVLRAHWISLVLGEQAYNDRKSIAGGFWSRTAHYQSSAIAANAVKLGPLGQELAEANESKEMKDRAAKNQPKVTTDDQKISVGSNGVIKIPAAACGKPSGHFASLKAHAGGTQIHCSGGFKAEYVIDAPRAGNYLLAAQVVTVQEGQKFRFTSNETKASADVEVPYTMGKWQTTKPVEISLAAGKNVIVCNLQEGSRGVSVKEFTLTPAK